MAPEGWSVGPVQDFLFLQRGFDLTQKNSVFGTIPVYSSSGIAYYHNQAKVKGPGIVTGRKGSVGPVYLVEEDFWPHDTTLWVKDFKGNDVKYIEYFLKYLRLERFDEASSVPTLNRNNVHGVKCVFPPLPEQKKIAQILSAWDKAITTTKQLLANRQQQKKALMQQLLTGKKRLLDKNGARFRGEWKSQYLKKLLQISKGDQLNKDTLSKSGEYAVINGGIEPSGYTTEYNADANTITISEGGNSCGFVGFQSARFWCGGHCYAVKNLKADLDFTYQLLKFNQPKIMKLRVGSGLPNIQKKDLEALSVDCPLSQEEQQKIAAVLTNADQEISVLQQKLKALKQEKKALMQQLLTGKRRVKPH
ncbi:MAG: restriction endonuclease subunit S [Pseudomonas sp.]|nr:restriction endonuclease subunit S [Pseudomonas sp.]|tara:strand:+ start:849 stop:1937 length:1089 start_codon:yes stop_codon:yes gene_type:complete